MTGNGKNINPEQAYVTTPEDARHSREVRERLTQSIGGYMVPPPMPPGEGVSAMPCENCGKPIPAGIWCQTCRDDYSRRAVAATAARRERVRKAMLDYLGYTEGSGSATREWLDGLAAAAIEAYEAGEGK